MSQRDGLDWGALRTHIANHAQTANGREALLSLKPFQNLSEVHWSLEAITEDNTLVSEGKRLVLTGVEDFQAHTSRAALGVVLENSELLMIANSVEQISQTARALFQIRNTSPTLASLEPDLDEATLTAGELYGAFNTSGELCVKRFPELRTLRQDLSRLHRSIRTALDDMVGSAALDSALQERFITTRRDRYVIPVRANFRSQVPGIVHGVSGSGATLFIEPQAVVDLNNRLRMKEAELNAAEAAIRKILSKTVAEQDEPLQRALSATFALDTILAKAAFGRSLKATRPVVEEQGIINLISARHPLLTLGQGPVVPNDIQITSQKRALIAVGPNAGGKTITLKTTGLAVQLVRHGLFVPAEEGSRVDLFGDVFTVIGDNQAVVEGTSSFSSHLLAIKNILAHANNKSLVLLDELGSGTDPSQGGALARATIETLLEKGARLVVTTHLSQPKTLASSHPNCEVAAMEYRDDAPTYRLLIGRTGESHAISTAIRLGIPEQVTDRARALLNTPERALVDALSAIEKQSQDLDAREEELGALKKSLLETERRLTVQTETIELRKKRLEEEGASAFNQVLRKAEKSIAAVVADLQDAPGHGRTRAAQATIKALQGITALGTEPHTVVNTKEIFAGETVLVNERDTTGVVISLSGAKARVNVGGITVTMPTSGLTPTSPNRKKQRKPLIPQDNTPSVNSTIQVDANTLDLRGQRVDEGLVAVDDFLDSAVITGFKTLFILHGHGTGAMKKAVRQHLKRAKSVQLAKPADAGAGGDAFTVVTLH
jgi:DNA mismatch repair protein MutS2